jgi:hypothetical protein
MSASGLDACETVDSRGDVAIIAGLGLQLEEDGQSPRRLSGVVEQHAKVV